MSLPRPIRVVGSGSGWGDDAVAWEVIAQLRTRVAERPDVELFAVHGAEQILDVLDAHGTLILIDAVSSGAPAGTIHCFEWPDRRARIGHTGSTHSLCAATVLELATALGVLPSRVVVCGIEVQCLEGARALSAPVEAAVPELVRRLGDEIGCAPILSNGRTDRVA